MSFDEFLVRNGHVTAEQIDQATRHWSGRPDTIGALGLKLGLLTLGQIDRLLETQLGQRRLFGQLAIQKGFLSQEQVDRLLQLQHLDRHLDLGKVLVAAGHLEADQMIDAVNRYLAADQVPQLQE